MNYKVIDLDKLDPEVASSFKSHVKHKYDDAKYSNTNKINSWHKATQYYLGEMPVVPEHNVGLVSGRKENVVRKAVDTVLPELQAIFCENDAQAVKFRPLGDIHADKKLNEQIPCAVDKKINDIFLRENNGYKITGDTFLSTLSTGDGFEKVHYDVIRHESVLDVENAPATALTEVMENWPDTDFRQSGFDMPEPVQKFWDDLDEDGAATFNSEDLVGHTFSAKNVELLRIEEKPLVEYVHNGNMFISSTATCLDDAQFIGERIRTTKAKVLQRWPDEEDVIKKASEVNTSSEAPSSNVNILESGQQEVPDDFNTSHVDNLEIEIHLIESYIDSSLLEDGKKGKKYRVFAVESQGFEILEVSEVDSIPYCKADAFPLHDSLYGQGFYHRHYQDQDFLFNMLMQMELNAVAANFRRYTAVKGAYDRKSLLDNRPGGVVEIQTAGAVESFPYHPLPAQMFPMYDIVKDSVKEDEHNVLGTEQLNNIAQATMAMAVQNAEMDTKRIAKNLAYSLVRPRFEKLYKLIRDLNLDIELEDGTIIQGNQLPEIADFHVDINTANDTAREIGQKMNILEMAKQASEVNSYLYNEDTVYSVSEDICKAMGMDNPLPDPAKKPEPTPYEKALQMQQEVMEAEGQFTLLNIGKYNMYLKALEVIEKEADIRIKLAESPEEIQRAKEQNALALLELAQKAEGDLNSQQLETLKTIVKSYLEKAELDHKKGIAALDVATDEESISQ